MAQVSLKVGGDNWLYKKESLMAYNDENGNFKPAPFEFSRASGATRVNSSGLIESVGGNVPRINYDLNEEGQVSSTGALLLEPARSNLVTQSEYFTGGTELIYTQNAGVSPSGDSNATFLSPTVSAVASYHYNRFVITNTIAGYLYSISIFLKKGDDDTYNYVLLNAQNTSNGNAGPIIDLKTGVKVGFIGYDYPVIIDNYGNGWYRLSYTVQASATTVIIDLNVLPTQVSAPYIGNGTSGVYVWGMQFESSAYATSYIPTNGSIVTRTAETSTNGGVSNVFSSTGVFYSEIKALYNDGTFRRLSLSDGTSNNVVQFYYRTNNDAITWSVISNGASQGGSFYTINDALEYIKVAISYKLNDMNFWVNGFLVQDDETALMPVSLSRIDFRNAGGGGEFYGSTRNILTYKTSLTNAELEELTSWTSFNELANELLYTIR